VRVHAALAALLVLMGGCATTAESDPRDPLEPLNRGIYRFNEVFDDYLARPVATAYHKALHEEIRSRVRNFFSNIGDVFTGVNSFLQGKFQDGVEDWARFAFNSTFGLFGLHDVATDMGLEKHNEDFGQTLGRWGLGDGPYLVLPFLEPSSFRDAIGWLVDYYTDPITYVDQVDTRNILWGTRFVSRRAELLDTTDIVKTAALDPYEFVRDAYLQRRRNLVYDGNPPNEDDIDIKVKPKPGALYLPPAAAGTILVSRDLTPAQLEAQELEAARARSREPRAEASPGTGVARLWVPVVQ